MNEKDAHVKKILSELGLRDDPKLTPEQEDLLKYALSDEERFIKDVLSIFDHQ